MSKDKLIVLGLVVICLVMLFLFQNLLRPDFLTFSDAAKFADVVRQLSTGNGYTTDFSFFANFASQTESGFSANWVLPGMPFMILLFSLLFGVTDTAVLATSSFFYILLVFMTFLLGKKIFNQTVGVLSALAVAVNINILDYATSGASETLFMFLIVATFYFVSLENNKGVLFAMLTAIAMYLTRPQAIIYILGLVIYYLLLHRKNTKNLISTISYLIAGFIVIELLIYLLKPILPIESLSYRLFVTLGQHASQTGTVGLRSVLITNTSLDILPLLKTAFFNLYNFYRSFGDVLSPYLAALFGLSIFYFKDRKQKAFTFTSVFVVVMTLLAASLTLPLRRYVHPAIPFIFIPGIAVLVDIVFQKLKTRSVAKIVSFGFICIFVIGQALGYILLDSRTFNRSHNIDQPPVYVSLSQQLKSNTHSENVIVTNLDTWGTWYGERKTVWYPLEPEMLESVNSNIDAIYLTNYKIDDENYYMGEGWREVFNNPTSHNNAFINDNFEFVEEFTIPAEETYENQEGRVVLFVRK